MRNGRGRNGAPVGRPVIADVAREAGVSAMTVSRVLNGFPGVADGTRARVEAAVAALGYRANPAARVLAGGRSRTLGVVAMETDQFGPSHILFGVEAAARAAGHMVTFASMAGPTADDLRATVDLLRAAHVDGVLVVAPFRGVLDAIATLGDEVAVVAVGGEPAPGVFTVNIDQRAGARLATRHLLDLGHHTVHHVRGPMTVIDGAARARGWSEALRGSGAPRPDALTGDWSAAGGYAAGLQLARDRKVSAVFAANDQMALGVLRAFAESGRRVPEDVSVVGFDDTPESGYFLPPLTTVRQDFGEVGRRAVELLISAVGGSTTEQHVTISPNLVVRDSTAPR